MKRRDLLAGGLLTLVSSPMRAQSPSRTRVLGALSPTLGGIASIRDFTLPELARLGFVEGQNLNFRGLSADGAYDRLPDLARELVAIRPDVIIAVAPVAIRAARAATTTIPIVMSFAGEDPVEAGWVETYNRPGGNTTGLVMLAPELEGKRLQILHEAFPARRRIGVLLQAVAQNTPTERAVRVVGERLGLDLVVVFAAGAADYDGVFAEIRAAKVEALAVGSGPVLRQDASRIADLAMQAGIPSSCEWRESAEKGCLLSYAPKLPVLWGRTADFVARLLNGASPADMPLEEPTAFELVLNARTARMLQLELPPTLLANADFVIE